MQDEVGLRALGKLFRGKHVRLAPVFDELHRVLLDVGPDVAAYMPTVYVGYTVSRKLFAAIEPNAEGYLDLGLAVPPEIEHERLYTPEKSTWRYLTRHVRISDESDIDPLLREWIWQAYTAVQVLA
jgi:hypothetical protein